LLDTLTEPNVGRAKRWEAYTTLQRVDERALQLAVPVLVEWLDQPDIILREDASDLLKRIDVTALVKANKRNASSNH
jgi:hypothetical protein